MDPALQELATRGDEDDEVAVLIRLRDPDRPPRAARIVSRFGEIVTARVRRGSIADVWADPAAVSVKAPQEYSPDVEVEESEGEPEEPNDVRRPAGTAATGRGVVIGLVDWGCDFAHPALIDPATGTTKLLALWDQRPAPPGLAEPYGYGRIFDAARINEALRQDDPYAALGYHPADFDSGPGAHGTHTTSIAAGNGAGGGPAGMAPDADIVFVNLAGRRGAEVPLGASTELLEAISMIVTTAAGTPCVINCSLGRHAGEHTGRSLVELAIDRLLSSTPGLALTASGGNYHLRRTHASWRLGPGQSRRFRVEIDPVDPTVNQVDIWYPGRDRLLLEVAAVGREHRLAVPLGERGTVEVDGRVAVSAYHRHCDPNNGDNQISLFLEPGAAVGTWEVALVAEDVVDGRVHAWIERDSGCRACQARFTAGDEDRRSTLGSIATGFRSLVIGAVNDHHPDRPLAPFSSSGPTRDGRQKPDCVAPGFLVLGARSCPRGGEPGPRYVRMSGTSMAAPMVAGTVALLFEAAGRKLRIEETREALLASCDPPEDGADLLRLGSGYVNPERALSLVTRTHGDVDEAASDATGVPEATAAGAGGGLRCRRFAGDADLEAVLVGRLRLAAPGAVPSPAAVLSAGPAVRKIQQALIDAGHPLPLHGADGRFGAETGRSLVRFKTERRISPADPIVGPATLRALDALCGGGDRGCSPAAFRVAVVGGGFAGLMAAWSLRSGGSRVTVFEASDRLGGRVRTDRSLLPGRTLEAGAELIGENHPTWRLLARTFGLHLQPVTDHPVRVRMGDVELSRDQVSRLKREVRVVQERIAAEAAAISPLQPWNSPRAAAFDAISVADRIDRGDMFGPVSSPAKHYFQVVTENDQCSPLGQQSYLGFLAAVKAHALPGNPCGYWDSTETHRCAGGNDQLAGRLASNLPDVRLNSPVTSLLMRVGDVRVSFGTPVRQEDFDYVVLASPPAVWPRVDSATPFRPRDYTMADGPAVKFLTTFDTRFWEPNHSPAALWDRLGSVWEGTDGQLRRPGYALSVYSGDGCVQDAATYPQRLEQLYPGYRANAKATSFVNWPAERWIRTGNSIPARGQVTTVGKNLSRPFEGRLVFAGEQASPGFFGYMEGALQSGIRAAGLIALSIRARCAGSLEAAPDPDRSGDALDALLPLDDDALVGSTREPVAVGSSGGTNGQGGPDMSMSSGASVDGADESVGVLDWVSDLDEVLSRRAAAIAPDGAAGQEPWLAQVLRATGIPAPPRLTEAALFDAFATRAVVLPSGLDRELEVVAGPGSRVPTLRSGDLVLSRGRGSPFGSVAVVAAGDLRHRGQLRPAGYTTDSRLPGLYVHVLDPAPHPWSHRYARRITDPRGVTPGHVLILRHRPGDTSTENEPAGRCPDIAVPPASRPRLLLVGSVHAAVREAQRKLNALHRYRIAAGLPGITDAPLVEDCVFGRNTRTAVLSFQRLVFPATPAEQDGKVGVRTWAQLDAIAVGSGGAAQLTIEQLYFAGPSGISVPLGWDEVLGLDTPSVTVCAVASGLPAEVMPRQIEVELSSRPPNRVSGTGGVAAPALVTLALDGPDPGNPTRRRYRGSRPLTGLGDLLTVETGISEMATVVRSGGTSDAAFRTALGGIPRGHATQPTRPGSSTGSEATDTPDAMALFRAGGVEVLEVTVRPRTNWVTRSARRLARSPADVFYYSGHGLSGSGKLAIETTGLTCGTPGGRFVDWLGPADLAAVWPAGMDLDVLIIAGCSVLRIDFSTSPPSGPGLGWARLLRTRGGPLAALLGYQRGAPCDIPNGNAIAAAMAARLKAGSRDFARDWLTANGDRNANNAVAIDAGGFWRIDTTLLGGFDIVGPQPLPP